MLKAEKAWNKFKATLKEWSIRHIPEVTRGRLRLGSNEPVGK